MKKCLLVMVLVFCVSTVYGQTKTQQDADDAHAAMTAEVLSYGTTLLSVYDDYDFHDDWHADLVSRYNTCLAADPTFAEHTPASNALGYINTGDTALDNASAKITSANNAASGGDTYANTGDTYYNGGHWFNAWTNYNTATSYYQTANTRLSEANAFLLEASDALDEADDIIQIWEYEIAN